MRSRCNIFASSLLFFLIGIILAFIICIWFVDGSLDIQRSQLQHHDKTLLKNISIGNVDVLILIFSRPQSSNLRQTIRGTWVSDLTHKTAYKFLISIENISSKSDLQQEIHQYNDIVLLHKQSFLSSQQLLVSLKWAVKNFNFKYILKCNDATYVSVHKLLKEIKTLPAESLIWGYFIGNQNVTRDGPKAEREWNLCLTYLPYPGGGGYIISHNLVDYVIKFAYLLKHMDHEDIALGVWLSPLRHITRYHDIRFNTDITSRGCLNHYLISHPETIDSMRTKYKNLHEKGHICEMEEEIIKPYYYNWTVPVEFCCLT